MRQVDRKNSNASARKQVETVETLETESLTLLGSKANFQEAEAKDEL